MKHIILILLAVIIFSCSDGFDEVTAQLKEETSIEVIQEFTEPDEITISKSAMDKYTLINAHYEWSVFTFDVQYKIFVNENHPHGYVIIQSVIERIEDDEYTITPVYKDDPKLYIENIHNPEAFICTSPEGDRGLDDIVVLEMFRTAEAIAVAQQASVVPNYRGIEWEAVVNLADVVSAKQRMEGRTVGVPYVD